MKRTKIYYNNLRELIELISKGKNVFMTRKEYKRIKGTKYETEIKEEARLKLIAKIYEERNTNYSLSRIIEYGYSRRPITLTVKIKRHINFKKSGEKKKVKNYGERIKSVEELINYFDKYEEKVLVNEIKKLKI